MRAPSATPTRDRILDAALTLFGTRGFEAVSLDEIAVAVGVRKQTVLYWFASKDELLGSVVERTADELVLAVDNALGHAGEGFARVEAVVKAVFRPAVRRPALLGLVRELNRLGPAVSLSLRDRFQPLIERGVSFLRDEMTAGRMRQGDPHLMLAISYAAVFGMATEPEALRAVGWQPDATGLRHLRAELLAHLRGALAPVC
jgi:TetR/AcrR family transcriptional regulator